VVLSNPKDEAFCQAYVRSGNASESWRSATGKTKDVDVHGAEFLVKHGIKERIAETRTEMERKFSISREEWLDSFLRLSRKAETAGDFTAAKGVCVNWDWRCCNGIHRRNRKWLSPPPLHRRRMPCFPMR
jgi:hypothetical protein